ncbi:MAG: nucleotidyltransferase family protein [Candidatus Omnitrophota bacterium]
MANKDCDCSRLDEILERLTREKTSLSNNFGVLDLAIFGSFAKNQQRKESDVDIYVKLKQEYKTFDNFMELRFFLEERLNRKVDLVTQEAIREELKSQIFSEAVHV